MNNFYRDKSEFVLSSWTMDQYDLRTALETFHRHDFQSVEIWADNVHLDPRIKPDLAAIKRDLRAFSQQVHSVHSPFRWFDPRPDTEPAFRAYRMDLWRQTIDHCAELACPIMVVHAVDRVEYNYPMDQRELVGNCLSDLCAYGKRAGVMIALENIADGRRTDEISCTLVNQARLFPGIGLRYCLDIGHVPLSGADLFAEADAAGRDLVTLHIHNNDLVSDAHNLPDDGLIDWRGLYEHVRKAGYQGQFVLEVLGRGHQPDIIAQISGLFD